jgi:hypothetical protein
MTVPDHAQHHRLSMSLARSTELAWRWHGRYGHLGFQGLKKLAHGAMVRGLPLIELVDQACQGCLAGKQHRNTFMMATMFHATRALELIHTDLCGTISPPTPGGKRMFLLIIDNMSRYMWLVLLATKDEVATTITRFCACV